MDFQTFVGEYALECARSGDLTRLAERIRNGDNLSNDEREFLADFLEGKIRFRAGTKKGRMQNPTGNPVKRAFGSNAILDVEVARAVRWLMNENGDRKVDARRKLANIIGETEKNVENRIERYEKGASLEHVTARMAEDYERRPLLLMLDARNK